jgi:glycosyltransferase involved in cell wall biosynthesis
VKILFISRSSLYADKGGDTIQILNTATFLKKINIEVDIRLCNEVIDYAPYDVLHFFNIIRPADILKHIKYSGKPYVISTIYLDYSEFEKKIRRGITGLIFKFFSRDFIEYLKVIARALLNKEKIISPSYLLLGHRRSIKKIIKGAYVLLPNSHSEYERIVAHYKTPKRFMVIPNGIDPDFFQKGNPGTVVRDDTLIICAGRVEGRKNQLNLIKALNGTNYNLIIIGSPAVNQINYYETCKKTAASNIRFINNVDQKKLIEYYQRSKVHVLPSWFETTGLSSLEAAVMGCNIVITDKGDTKEYFENYAFYCDPASPESIYEAVRKASAEKNNEILRNKILTKYTWQQAANKTLTAYQGIIGK